MLLGLLILKYKLDGGGLRSSKARSDFFLKNKLRKGCFSFFGGGGMLAVCGSLGCLHVIVIFSYFSLGGLSL